MPSASASSTVGSDRVGSRHPSRMREWNGVWLDEWLFVSGSDRKVLWNAPPCPARLGRTTVPLPLGGVASTDLGRVRRPLVRPFWLLAMGLVMFVAVFVWLRVNMS
jgi:hypothetical protein